MYLNFVPPPLVPLPQSDLVTLSGPTTFTGYGNDLLGAPAIVVALLVDGQQVQEAAAGSRVEVLLDRTPFYAESGGQVGSGIFLLMKIFLPSVHPTPFARVPSILKVADHGLIRALGPDGSTPVATLVVGDVKKAAGGSLFVHSSDITEGALRVGSKVRDKLMSRWLPIKW